ncbi:hypothetical protein FB645_006000 [Coemansia sp. IMI 203386]|nr:hypothetical protein FB645_006000 [Coemansia sp. IMI 203386]
MNHWTTATARALVNVRMVRWYATRQIPDNNNNNTVCKTTAEQSMLLPGQVLVGAPHPISNIRPIRFYIPLDETPQELFYRNQREQAFLQDHVFWTDNNLRFERGKTEFEQQVVCEKGVCTLDDLSVYYRRYQEDSYGRHVEYNRMVWKRNLDMVVPGIRAWWQAVKRRRRRQSEAVARYSSEQQLYDGREGKVVERRATGSETKQEATGSGAVDRRAEKIKSYY